MAGICGIIKKTQKNNEANYRKAIEVMVNKLAYNPTKQIHHIEINEDCHFGNVVPISFSRNENFIKNESLGISCLIDGYIFISDTVKTRLSLEFKIPIPSHAHAFLPYLYHAYHRDLVNHITGSFNLFIYNSITHKALLVNDKPGLLPLFLYETDSLFIFASKIECILASGLMNNIAFDKVTLFERLVFNYPLSHHTFIKDITTMKAASCYGFSNSAMQHSTYWGPEKLIFENPVKKIDSLDIIDSSLKKSIYKTKTLWGPDHYITLTGGWDGRLLLSYLIGNNKYRVKTFSFGSENSPDVQIPKNIAQCENITYNPFILNEDYIHNDFAESARNTIILSNGLRSYKRTHYVYSMQLLGQQTKGFISGNFGDEIFKFSQLVPSEVISSGLIEYFQSELKQRPNIIPTIEKFSSTEDYPSGLMEEWNERLHFLENELSAYNNLSHKFFHLKISRIANRYFGYELNSYNDFVLNYSPFLDDDFLIGFHQTVYAGIHYPFNTNNLIIKHMTSMLYAQLIKRNCESLLHYATDRGFSMKDMMHPAGKLLVYYKKKRAKKDTVYDPYNLSLSGKIFMEIYKDLISKNIPNGNVPLYTQTNSITDKGFDKILSLNYWMIHIAESYM